jgi:endonuclease/exonuclease/phosphatase family metal-dependent hydrolase
MLKVVTYNIRFANPGDGDNVWVNRRDAVASFLQQQDVCGLQEVTQPQFQELRERLTSFDSYGVGRDDGKDGGEHAPIFYRRDRFESIEQGTFWLSESPQTPGSRGWDAALPRTCTWVRLREKASGKRLLIANTHFDHIGKMARAESGKLVSETLRQMAGDCPVVLMGDFNCEPNSEPFLAILAGGFFTAARSISKTAPVGPESTWNGFEAIVPGQVIDHVFVSDAWNVFAHAVLDPRTDAGRFASDHLPVRVLLGVRPAEAGN